MILPVGKHGVPNGHLASVVTTLEMTKPTLPDRLPFPDGINARKEVLDLATFRALFREIGAPWLWASGLTTPDAEIAATLTDRCVDYWLITRGDDTIGLIELDFRTTGTCELVLFGVIPAAMGQGLGQPMMALAQSEAFGRGISRLTVSTCNYDSPAALPFYRKAGFHPVGLKVDIYPDPRATGALPPDTAPHVPIVT